MKKFEHRVNTLQSKPTESWLCAMGAEGWELVSVQWIANYGYEVYFKKELEEKKGGLVPYDTLL